MVSTVKFTSRALLCVLMLLPPALIAAGWDWLHPGFNANNLNGVATISATEAFAVGDAGNILRYDGRSWEPVLLATHANFEDVWAGSATDVFAVANDVVSGTGFIYHYDGTQWKQQQQYSAPLVKVERIWGSSGSDVFAILVTRDRNEDIVLHYDGNEWTLSFAAPMGIRLFQIWGLSSTEVFAVGSDYWGKTYVYRYDGEQWSDSIAWAGEFYPSDLWGTSASNLYMVGQDSKARGHMLHYDGSEWQPVNEGGWPSGLTGVWGTSASDIFAVGDTQNTGRGVIYHYDGTTWSEQHHVDGVGFHALQGSSASDVVAVGEGGILAHYDGAQWQDLFKSDWYFELLDIWGFSPTDVFLVGVDPVGGRGVILHYDGTDFEVQLSIDDMEFKSAWGPSHNDLFVVGRNSQQSVIYHYDGRSWVEQFATDDALVNIWGASGMDVFAVGQIPSETEEGEFGKIHPVDFLEDVFGGIRPYEFQEDEYGRIYHYDGVAWSLQYTLEEPYTFLNSVWGTSGSNVYAVGGAGGNIPIVDWPGILRGYIYHYDGSSWVRQAEYNRQNFVDVWGSSPTDIFVLGHDDDNYTGTVFHNNGTGWQQQYATPPEVGSIFVISMAGSSGSDVYAAAYILRWGGGISGLIHYDGEEWSFVQDGFFGPVPLGIWTASANDAFIVGTQGMVLHYDGNGLVEAAPDQASGVTLDQVQTASSPLTSEQLRERYGTPSDFRPMEDLMSLSASVSPAGQVGTFRFRYRHSGGSANVSSLMLYRLSSDGQPLQFEYAGAANSFQDGMWWITGEDGAYLDSGAALQNDGVYFINFAIRDDGPGGYDLSAEPGTIEDPLVLGTQGGCPGCFSWFDSVVSELIGW